MAMMTLPLEISGAETADELFIRCFAYVISRLEQAEIGEHPFFHLFVEDIFPPDFYTALRGHMVSCKHSGNVQTRHQDSHAFLNTRTNLYENSDAIVECIRRLFSDSRVKRALLRKFYVDASEELINLLNIHEEFEYFYTSAGRFQNIHVDIPPKYMSFVFYIPENPVPEEAEIRNGTVLYDKNLAPHYMTRFKDNSVCIFVPHFYSYHGFASTIDRDVLVMFYVSQVELQRWRSIRQEARDTAPFTGLLDAIESKLKRYPTIELGIDEKRLNLERDACRINAPQGRVLL